MKKIFFVLAGAVALLALAMLVYRKFQFPQAATESDKRFNLILISIDTVRMDCLQLYNPKGAPTPNLNRIAEKSFIFTNAISQVPYTLPSHCTMLTGTYPMKHHVQENITSKLSDSAFTLAEALKEKGYNTAGFIGSMVLAANTGIQQGFDYYDDSFSTDNLKREDLSGIQKNADAVYRSFQRWFQKKDSGNYFAFLHFYDPHSPYEPPAPFAPAEKSEIEMYKGELRYVDSVIGKLYDELSSNGTWSNTVLIITGDHGEMLGDHGEMTHGYFIYQQALKVPVLIAPPANQQKHQVDAVIQLVDLMPTILDLLDISVPTQAQGESFEGLLRGRQIKNRCAYSESLTSSQHFRAMPLRSIQDHSYKYIDSARAELYDLKRDPLETDNLIQKKSALADQMKTKLNQMLVRFNDSGNAEKMERTPEEREKLASLGYISGKSSDKVDSSRDAKDYIKSWVQFSGISTLLQTHKFQECLNVLDSLHGRGIDSAELSVYQARAIAGLGDHARAISILQKVITDDPQNIQAQMALAYSLRSSGKPEAAVKIYQHLMEKEDSVIGLQNYARVLIRYNKKEELLSSLSRMKAQGKFTDRHDEVLGEIYLNLNQLADARPYLKRGIENHPDSSNAFVNYSALLANEGKIQEAILLLESNRPRFQDADYLIQLGRLLDRAGQVQKEVDVFQSVVHDYPQDPRGFFYLGKIVLEHHGNPQAVIQLAEKGLSLKPDSEFLPFGYFLLADAYTALGDRNKAQQYLKIAQKSD